MAEPVNPATDLNPDPGPDALGWFENEHGLWCPLCGELVAKRPGEDEEVGHVPDMCSQCGFPDEIDPEAI